MDVIRLGLGYRALRRRRRLTQADVGIKAGVSRSVVYRIERGHADDVAVHTLVRVAAALQARVEIRLLWQGEGLDRLLDVRHAGLVDRVLQILVSDGWEVATEVSFNVYGERGSIDILGYHPSSRCLLVVEVKSVLPDMQSMLAGLDRKGRLARTIAHDRGWHPTSVSKLLVLPEDRTARRRVREHCVTFDAALPARNVELRRWIKSPDGRRDGLMFLSDAHHAGARHRVRSS
jgi:transcriptional regulator with XRE-family HTH domain